MRLKLINLFVLLLLPLWAMAEDFTLDNVFYYKVVGDHEVSIYIAEEAETDIVDFVIPSTVEYGGETYTVTEVERLSWDALETIKVPSSVKRIKWEALGHNPNLKSVVFDEGCEYIDGQAFIEDYRLKEVHLPNSLKEASYNIFTMCCNLEELHIPANTKLLQGGNISDSWNLGFLPSLKKITVDEGNPYCKSVNGILYSYREDAPDAFVLKHFPAMYNMEEAENPEERIAKTGFMIPADVNWYDLEAFAGTRYLKHLVLPSKKSSLSSVVSFNVMLDYSPAILPSDMLQQFGEYGYDLSLPINKLETLTTPVDYSYVILSFDILYPMEEIVHLFNFSIFDNQADYDQQYPIQAWSQDQIKVHYVKKTFYHNLYDWLMENLSGYTDEKFDAMRLSYKIPFTMNSSGYATFCRDFDCDFNFSEFAENNSDLKIYVATSLTDTELTLQEVADKYVPSRTGADNYEFHGVVLKGTPGKTYYYAIGEKDYASGEQITHEDLMSQNLLVGTPVEKYVLNRDEDENAIFVLKKGRFQYLLDDMGVFSAQKAYLSVPRSQVQEIIDVTRNNVGGASAKLSMRFENADGTTDIDGIVQTGVEKSNEGIFDLQGRRLSETSAPGIYIVNGKKVVVK